MANPRGRPMTLEACEDELLVELIAGIEEQIREHQRRGTQLVEHYKAVRELREYLERRRVESGEAVPA